MLLWSCSSPVLQPFLGTTRAGQQNSSGHGWKQPEHYNSSVASRARVVVPFVPAKTVVHVVGSLVLFSNRCSGSSPGMRRQEGCSRDCTHRESGIWARCNRCNGKTIQCYSVPLSGVLRRWAVCTTEHRLSLQEYWSRRGIEVCR